MAARHGFTLIDAPVLGTKQPAEEGKLVVLASGPEAARERVQPIFDALGQKTIWVGETGAGTRLKMVANSWVLDILPSARMGLRCVWVDRDLTGHPAKFADRRITSMRRLPEAVRDVNAIPPRGQ